MMTVLTILLVALFVVLCILGINYHFEEICKAEHKLFELIYQGLLKEEQRFTNSVESYVYSYPSIITNNSYRKDSRRVYINSPSKLSFYYKTHPSNIEWVYYGQLEDDDISLYNILKMLDTKI